MFAKRYFCVRLFATRYFPKVGATQTFQAKWAIHVNTLMIGPVAPEPIE